MNTTPNVAASVMARLFARAKTRGDDYQLLVTAYAFERLLFRLGQSPMREHFVLKGAMLLRLWSEQPYRATRDLDLLRRGNPSSDGIRTDLEAILATPVPDDGIEFNAAGLVLEPIRATEEYAGTRAMLQYFTVANLCATLSQSREPPRKNESLARRSVPQFVPSFRDFPHRRAPSEPNRRATKNPDRMVSAYRG